MKTPLEYHRYFCSKEMAYRGHDETDESLNPGKSKEFINVMLRTNPTFEQLHKRVIQTYKAYDYASKRSLLELIRALASEVRHLIEEQIDKAWMYSMLINECKDNAGHEELSTCFRFLNDKYRNRSHQKCGLTPTRGSRKCLSGVKVQCFIDLAMYFLTD